MSVTPFTIEHLQEQIQALGGLCTLYRGASMVASVFWDAPAQIVSNDTHAHAYEFDRCYKASQEWAKKVKAARKRLVASGYQVLGHWLTVRVFPAPSLVQQSHQEKEKGVSILTLPGPDTDEIARIVPEIKAAIIRLEVQIEQLEQQPDQPADAPCEAPKVDENAADTGKLTEREQQALRALLALGALDELSRKKTKEIANHVDGIGADPQIFSRPLVRLRKLGYIASKTGTAGGFWLLERGKRLAKHLKARCMPEGFPGS